MTQIWRTEDAELYKDRFQRRNFKASLCCPKVRNNHEYIARPGEKYCSLCNQVRDLHVSP